MEIPDTDTAQYQQDSAKHQKFIETMIKSQQVKRLLAKKVSQQLNLVEIGSMFCGIVGDGYNDSPWSDCKAVTFTHFQFPGKQLEIYFSQGKRKRKILSYYKFPFYSGIYTISENLRSANLDKFSEEQLGEMAVDDTHTLLHHQLDFEVAITENDRNIEFLKKKGQAVFDALRKIEKKIKNSCITLPNELFFIHTEQLESYYPDLPPERREQEITRERKAVFLIGLGHPLPISKKPHGLRQPDVDDWSSDCGGNLKGLNGDILLWDSQRNTHLEVCSMGIRVNKEALQKQCEITGQWEDLKDRLYTKEIQDGTLVHSIGGGIGVERVVMWMLGKNHIGQVASSVWPQSQIDSHELLL